MQEINSKNWEDEVEKSDKPVVVDFYATWCSPCKKVAPILEELEKEFGDKVRFVKFNGGHDTDLPIKMGIRSVPTIILFDKKDEKVRITGVTNKEEIKKQLGL